jgi:hypothetical protein
MRESGREKSGSDDAALSAIRTGIGVDEDFWESFKLVINNADGLASLLDVPADKISTWRDRVDRALEEVQKSDSAEDVSKNKKMIKTGLPEGGP